MLIIFFPLDQTIVCFLILRALSSASAGLCLSLMDSCPSRWWKDGARSGGSSSYTRCASQSVFLQSGRREMMLTPKSRSPASSVWNPSLRDDATHIQGGSFLNNSGNILTDIPGSILLGNLNPSQLTLKIKHHRIHRYLDLGVNKSLIQRSPWSAVIDKQMPSLQVHYKTVRNEIREQGSKMG